MLTQDFPRITLREAGDTERAITTALSGSRCDRWPAVTVAVAIMTSQNGTRACNALQQCPQGVAGNGRGGHYPPVCVSYPQPDGSHRGDVRRLHSRIDQLLAVLDGPGPVWEGDLPQQPLQAKPLQYPSLLIAKPRGRFVLMRWSDIYKAPRCMWQQSSSTTIQGGATWHQ